MGRSHPVFARIYPRIAAAMDEGGARELRERLLAGLTGRVVEVGAGSGQNLGHYPEGVTHVLAVEPEPYLRARAAEAAARVAVPVEVVGGSADALPVADGSVDAVVFSLVLCSVPDQRTALVEAARVLRPGGELRLFEHVAASTPGHARLQRVVDRLGWPLVAAGCHTSRDTPAAVEAAGFTFDDLDRFRFPEGLPSPTAPHVLGRARR